MAVVLVVDDEFGLGEIVQAMLEDEGHRVLTAIHGRAALERIAEHRPDLVFTDYMMPVMDGGALIRALRSDPALASIPVVLMSAVPPAGIDAAVTGHVAFLRKPFTPAQLLELVDRFGRRA